MQTYQKELQMSREPFAETEVLVAVMSGEYKLATARLEEFFPYELDKFERDVDFLLSLIHQTQRNRDNVS